MVPTTSVLFSFEPDTVVPIGIYIGFLTFKAQRLYTHHPLAVICVCFRPRRQIPARRQRIAASALANTGTRNVRRRTNQSAKPAAVHTTQLSRPFAPSTFSGQDSEYHQREGEDVSTSVDLGPLQEVNAG